MSAPFDSVFSRLAKSSSVRPLSKWDAGYLQVVLADFELHRRGAERHLEVRIPDDPLTIRDAAGKRVLEGESRAGSGAEAFERQLAEFKANPNLLACRFDCREWPMRFSNGGVLPVLHWEGRDYFLMFYRDVFPIGWNIANGASDDAEEWLDPTRIIDREFGEEVLLCDWDKRSLFVHDPPGAARPFAFHEDAIAAWTEQGLPLEQFARAPMPLKWIHGPDSVSVTFRGRCERHDGVFLSVTPRDHGIEVDRVALIRLTGDIRPLDGEIAKNQLFNHVVGLFDVERFAGFESREFKPDRVFHDGVECEASQLDSTIARYLGQVRQKGLRSPEQVVDYERETERFDLCPISRSLIGRYFEWRAMDQEKSAAQEPAARSVHRQPDGSDIFISHRSTHVNHARALHDYLEQRGHRVFFSDESLAKMGESDYARSINHALEQSRVFILLALHPDDLKSGWVDFEWKAFHCELLSGRKQGHLFTLLHDVGVDQLPLALRSRQSIHYRPSAWFDSFENLYRFVGPALSQH